jgi:hypothetical protein
VRPNGGGGLFSPSDEFPLNAVVGRDGEGLAPPTEPPILIISFCNADDSALRGCATEGYADSTDGTDVVVLTVVGIGGLPELEPNPGNAFAVP